MEEKIKIVLSELGSLKRKLIEWARGNCRKTAENMRNGYVEFYIDIYLSCNEFIITYSTFVFSSSSLLLEFIAVNAFK